MKESVVIILKKTLLNVLFVCLGSAALFSMGVQASAQDVRINEANNHVMGNNLKKSGIY